MKQLQISSITPTSFFPVKEGTLVFLQQAYTELLSSILVSNMQYAAYDPTKVYTLYGGTQSVGSTTTTFTAGAYFFDGEIYISPGNTITNPISGNTWVLNLYVSNYSTYADPVTFSDGTVNNCHYIRQAVFGTGTPGTGTLSGTGASDYGNLVAYSYPSGYGYLVETAEGLATLATLIEGQITTINNTISSGTWTNVTLTTGWTAVSGKTPQFRTDGMGKVHLRGEMIAGSGATSTFFTLPSGNWPSQLMTIPAYCFISSATAIKPINISTSGVVGTFAGSFGTGDTWGIDGISFINS